MTSRPHLIRLAQALVLAAFAVGAIATTATAASAPRPPDVRDAAIAARASAPDVFERYAATHEANAVPDVMERYASVHPYGVSSPSPLAQAIVSRPPDVNDAAAAAVAALTAAAYSVAGSSPAITPTSIAGARVATGSALSLRLVFDGIHVDDTTSPLGLRHQGEFTSNAPFCSAGSAVDVMFQGGGGQRRFTCLSGGDFVAQISDFPAEHGGIGSWFIVSGSGLLANLRGHGRFTGVHREDPRDPVAYRSTWQGTVALDSAPPVIAFSGATVQKLRRPAGSYMLRFRLSIRDESTDPVPYTLTVADARQPDAPLASKSGNARSGGAAIALSVRPKQGARKLVVTVRASDAVENAASKSVSIAVHAAASSPAITPPRSRVRSGA